MKNLQFMLNVEIQMKFSLNWLFIFVLIKSVCGKLKVEIIVRLILIKHLNERLRKIPKRLVVENFLELLTSGNAILFLLTKPTLSR